MLLTLGGKVVFSGYMEECVGCPSSPIEAGCLDVWQLQYYN